MKTSRVLRQCVCLAVIPGGLQAGPAHAEWSSAQAAVVALSDVWIDAELRHDEAALERILDDRLLAIFSSGRTIDRGAFIDWIVGASIDPFEVVKELVNIHGSPAPLPSRRQSAPAVAGH